MRPRTVDLLLAGAFLVVGQLEIGGLDASVPGVPGDHLAARLLWAGAAASVLLWRRHPGVLLAVATVVTALRYRYGLTPTGGSVAALLTFLALFAVGVHGTDARRSAVHAGLGVVVVLGTEALLTAAGYGPLVGAPTSVWPQWAVLYVLAAAAGVVLRDRTEALRAARVEAEDAPDPAAAVDEALTHERSRIARELHAVVTRRVSEAADAVRAARGALAASPARAASALRTARDAGQDALHEMRRLLLLLREEAPADELEHELTHPAAAGAPPAVPDAPARSWPRVDAGWLALPAFLLVAGVTDALLATGVAPAIDGTATTAQRLLGAVLMAAAFLPRRRWPFLTLGAVVAVILFRGGVFNDRDTLTVPLWVAAFVAGAYARPAWLGALASFASIVLAVLLMAGGPTLGGYVVFVLVGAAAWAIGFAGRRRLGEARELHALTAERERRHREDVERALTEERLHVARELHDRVGQGLTAIVLQCAGTERRLAQAPGRAAELDAALAVVQDVTREVRAELGELLAALDGRAEADVPRLSGLPELARRARRDGVHLDLAVDGDLDAVPPGVGAAAYRIVQEALANARKHAAGSAITARVRAAGPRLEIEVRNPVRTGHAAGPGTGFGLVGLTERVRVYDGRLDAGERAGAWVVRAELPLR